MYSKEQISRALSAPSDKSYFVEGYESQNDVLKAMHKALGQARDALKKALEISYNGFNISKEYIKNNQKIIEEIIKQLTKQ